MASLLTTVDNPFNPHTNFDEWYAFDLRMGYDTLGYLARITPTSPELTDEEQEMFAEAAIDEVIRLNPLGIYRKVEYNKK